MIIPTSWNLFWCALLSSTVSNYFFLQIIPLISQWTNTWKQNSSLKTLFMWFNVGHTLYSPLLALAFCCCHLSINSTRFKKKNFNSVIPAICLLRKLLLLVQYSHMLGSMFNPIIIKSSRNTFNSSLLKFNFHYWLVCVQIRLNHYCSSNVYVGNNKTFIGLFVSTSAFLLTPNAVWLKFIYISVKNFPFWPYELFPNF